MSDLTGRIVVIGASGQLGSELLRALRDLSPSGVDHDMVDIERPSAVSAMLGHFRPTLVINTAAYHNVERCETHADRAFAVNAVAVESLAAQCDNAGAALVHISTDYVFDGHASEPYAEDAPAAPLSIYGVSKLAGEHLVRRRTPRHFIVRSSGLYGVRGSSTKGYTFIGRMLEKARNGERIAVVDDVTFSPSYAPHVAQAIRAIVERGQFGTYHVTNAGWCTWYEFAVEIFRQAGLAVEVERTSSSAYPSYAVRPKFSALRHAALERLGLGLPPTWQAGIAAYLADAARA